MVLGTLEPQQQSGGNVTPLHRQHTHAAAHLLAHLLTHSLEGR